MTEAMFMGCFKINLTIEAHGLFSQRARENFQWPAVARGSDAAQRSDD